MLFFTAAILLCAVRDAQCKTRESTFKRLQPVRSVASGTKFYRLLPDKENTAIKFALVMYGCSCQIINFLAAQRVALTAYQIHSKHNNM